MPAGRWIFAYGSLIWRPAFEFNDRLQGYVRGWSRRFWQGSTDHRGVPGAAGRVVTLVSEPDAICWGVAYRIAGPAADEVVAGLDVREQGGYARHELAVLSGDGSLAAADALAYVATPDNPNYLGDAPLPEIAAQVRRSRGPSGPNVEYVVRLAQSLRDMGVADEHVFGVERLVTGSDGAADHE